MKPRELLRESFDAGLVAVDPLEIVPRHLPQTPPQGRTLVIGAGKAAAAMARAVELRWPVGAALSGLVITRYAHGLPTDRVEVVEAGHPVPDESGEQAARDIRSRVAALGADDLVLALFSGGGSSLLTVPADGLAMADFKQVTRELLLCGATIQEINTVRKHLSAIQGGRLAALSRAPIRALVVSDVTGDAPTHIASGPCAPDPSTFADALAILDKHRVRATAAVRARLEQGRDGVLAETPKPGDPVFAAVENRVIATGGQMLEAAAAWFRARSVEPQVLGDEVTGEARQVAADFAAQARQLRAAGGGAPQVLLSGGETTVTVRGRGRGGRNAEFLLALAIALDGAPGIHAIACDSDGIDGSEDNAGAVVAPDTLARARAQGLDPAGFLDDNDAYSFFEALGDLVVTGPTRTNVNDYRAILIL